MKKVILIAAIFIWATARLCAQQTDIREKLVLKFAPFSLLDPNRSVIQFGLEYKPLEWLGLQADYGYKFTPLQIFAWNSAKENHKYFTLRAETRFYFKPVDVFKFYLATEAFYIPQTYRLYNATVIRDTVEMQYDYSDINRSAIGGTLKAGATVNLGKRFMVDVYAGLGIRQRSIKHHTHIETPLPDYLFREWTSPVELHEGTKTLPHISLGAKIAYVLMKN